MFAAIKPRSAAFCTSSRASFQSCCSNWSMCTVTSLSTNCRVVSAIMRCSSVKSSGVKISSGVLSSIRKAPPLIVLFCSATADMDLLPPTLRFKTKETRNSFGVLLGHLLANLIRHDGTHLGIGLQDPHQIQFILLSLCRPALLIIPSPELSSDNIGKRSHWHLLPKYFHNARRINKTLLSPIKTHPTP